MSRKTIAEIIQTDNSPVSKIPGTKRSSANRKRLTIGSAKQTKPKVPKITKIFSNDKETRKNQQTASAKNQSATSNVVQTFREKRKKRTGHP